MIRKYLLYAFAFTSLIFTSCMDSFLDRNPYGAIDETTFYTEAEHANLGAMACYAKLQCLNGHWAFAQLELGMTLVTSHQRGSRMLNHSMVLLLTLMKAVLCRGCGNAVMKVLLYATSTLMVSQKWVIR